MPPWFQNLIPEWMKKSVCSCLIKRYLSEYIDNEITRDQLNLDLYNGWATAERIGLAIEALNELSDAQNWPIEFVDGYIDKILIKVPWQTIFSSSTTVEICGLKITVQPKQRKEDATSMFESMWNSMTSSMHLAEEYAKSESKENRTQVIEGIDKFAQTIESIVRRIKVSFKDTVIQVEHLPKESEKGVGLLINIDSIKYFDEASYEDPNVHDTLDNDDSKKAYYTDSFTTKDIIVEGVRLSTIEFASVERTVSRSVILSSSSSSSRDGADNTDVESTTNHTDDNEGTNGDSNSDIHIVEFGKFYNKQEVKIKLKQAENRSGPKVAIEINLGSLLLFMSPRQFHMLLELVDGFSSPDMEDNSNVPKKNQCLTRPMTEKDYARVEQQLSEMVNPLAQYQGFNLQRNQGWSSSAMDESSDSQYILMKATSSGMYESTASGFSSSMDSSMTSSMVSSMTDNTHHTHHRASYLDNDPTAEISHFQIRAGCVALILLHEDLLAFPTDNEKVLVKQMQNTSSQFFSKIDTVVFTGIPHSGFEGTHKMFDEACSLNHLRLLASPLHIEADEKTTSSAFSISGYLIANKLELIECLHDTGVVKRVPILNFKSSEASIASSAKPNVKLKFKHVQKTSFSSENKKGPKTDLTVNLDCCTMEFDISIIDRMTNLLNCPSICGTSSAKPEVNVWGTNDSQFGTRNVATSTMDLKVICPLLNFVIRFPIPDFRPPHDLSKIPWWERNVRPDFLTLHLHNTNFHTVFTTNQLSSDYNIECKILDIYYHETEHSPAIHIGRSGKEDKFASSLEEDIPPTSLSIKFFPKKPYEEEVYIPDPMTHSFYGAFENQGNPEPGPFHAKKVVHESDIPHNKNQKDDTEELVIPGDKSELEDFRQSTRANSLILVEAFLPLVSVQLQSKHTYEMIYNRINNDLLLWEPSAPKPPPKTVPGYPPNVTEFELDDDFIMAKSGIQIDSDSDCSEESESQGSNVYFSTYDTKSRHSPKSIGPKKRRNSQSEFVLSLSIEEGLLNLVPPVRDVTSNVIPEQQGEFLLKLIAANVFVVSGYKGDTDLGYVCVEVSDAHLFHCDIQQTPSTTPPLREVGSIPWKNLLSTLYRSDKKVLACATNSGKDREMFSVAIKIQANHETHHVKAITVSLGLNKATLRHRMTPEPNSWITQLIDFFNVDDYPISGYVAKDVLTELHLNLWDCSVDYRPFHVPLRSFITVGNFSLSSHLTAASNTSTLLLLFEDCGLFLSEKAPPKNGVPSNASVDLIRDYVNVVEVALFEISIKTVDKKIGINPHFDLRISNNMMHIRTCSDSGRALFQLLTYYINDGDFNPEPPAEDHVSVHSQAKSDEDFVTEQFENILSETQQEKLTQMLGDAMEESPKASKVNPHNSGVTLTGTKIFYFPDENETLEDHVPNSNLPQVSIDLGDVNLYNIGRNNDSDDDFCMVGNEAVADYYPQNGDYEITYLTDEPIQIIENHFTAPIGRRDVLEPPKNFPTPTARYTLRDMSIEWQMFGGHDFKSPSSLKKEVRFLEKRFDRVSFSSASSGVIFEPANANTVSWMKKGGENRDQNVLLELQLNKVKFRHEQYPESGEKASLQILSISDIEIRDRLEASEYNKFLYQYFGRSRPKQTHSNMVIIKALHVKPDPKLKAQECLLKIAVAPIRLNIDQDALQFAMKFFKELSGDVAESNQDAEKETALQNTPTHQPPIISFTLDDEEEMKEKARQVVSENLILLESKYHAEPEETPDTVSTTSTVDAPVYFRYVEFSRDVQILLDYKGKSFDMTQGAVAGFVMGLGQLSCSQITLKRIVYKHGLLGVEKLFSYLLKEWLADIKKNQLTNIIGGVGPIFAFVKFLHGLRDLFWLPIEQYQKDGRIVRGLQRGANSFTTSTALAALELTSRIIYFIQITAETAYDMLSPGPSIRMKKKLKQKGRKKRHYQAQDIREGLTNACLVVKEGIGETADNIVQVATLEKEQKGISGALGAVIRQIPATVIKPVVIATEAASNVLGGVQSQLVPDARTEANQKWRSDP